MGVAWVGVACALSVWVLVCLWVGSTVFFFFVVVVVMCCGGGAWLAWGVAVGGTRVVCVHVCSLCVCGCCVVDLWYVVAWLFCLWVLLVYLLDARVLYVLCAGGDSWGLCGLSCFAR